MATIRNLYRGMNRLSDLFEKVIKIVLFLLVISCALDLAFQVLYRFVLVHYVSFRATWTTEYAQDAIIWITYLTVGLCVKNNSMASVNLLFDRLQGKAKYALYYLTRAIILVFLVVGLKYGWINIQAMSNWNSTNLHLPGWILHGAPFMGCILMLYEVIVDILGTVCGELKPFVGRGKAVEDEPPMELTEGEKETLEAMKRELEE